MDSTNSSTPSLVGASVRQADGDDYASDVAKLRSPSRSTHFSSNNNNNNNSEGHDYTTVNELADEGALIQDEQEYDQLLDASGQVKSSVGREAIITSGVHASNISDDKKQHILDKAADAPVNIDDRTHSGFVVVDIPVKHPSSQLEPPSGGGDDDGNEEPSTPSIYELKNQDSEMSLEDLIDSQMASMSAMSSNLQKRLEKRKSVTGALSTSRSRSRLRSSVTAHENVIPDSVIENDSLQQVPAGAHEGMDSPLVKSRSQSTARSPIADRMSKIDKPHLARGDSYIGVNEHESLAHQQREQSRPGRRVDRGGSDDLLKNLSTGSKDYLRSVSRSRSRVSQEPSTTKEDLMDEGALVNDDLEHAPEMTERVDLHQEVLKEEDEEAEPGPPVKEVKSEASKAEEGKEEKVEVSKSASAVATKDTEELNTKNSRASEIEEDKEDNTEDELSEVDESKAIDTQVKGTTQTEDVGSQGEDTKEAEHIEPQVESTEEAEEAFECERDSAENSNDSKEDIKEDITEADNTVKSNSKNLEVGEPQPASAAQQSGETNSVDEIEVKDTTEGSSKEDQQTRADNIERIEDVIKDVPSSSKNVEEPTENGEDAAVDSKKEESLDDLKEEDDEKKDDLPSEPVEQELEQAEGDAIDENVEPVTDELASNIEEAKDMESAGVDDITEKTSKVTLQGDVADETERLISELEKEIDGVASVTEEPLKEREIKEEEEPKVTNDKVDGEESKEFKEAKPVPLAKPEVEDKGEAEVESDGKEDVEEEEFHEPTREEIIDMLKDEPVFLYTSLAGGGFHMPQRTNKLATILTANRIEFKYKDLGTDEEARNVWRRYSKGRLLPGVVRGKDDIIGNWEEIEEANEDYRVRELIYETL